MASRSSFRLCAAPLLVILAYTGPVFADRAPEEVLKGKGLTKVAAAYLLPEDAKIAEHMRAIRKAEAGLKAYTKKRRDLEKDITKTEQSIIRWGREIVAINGRMGQESNNVKTYNELVAETQRRQAAIREAEQYVDKKREALGRMVAPGDLVTATLEVTRVLEAAARQYEQLAADPAVTSALAGVNATGGAAKAKLGPSARFLEELPRLQRQREMLKSSVIRMEIAGGVPQVPVTLNGSSTIRMIVDSGASLVTLTATVAEQLNLKPGPNDPEITLVIADGKQVKAREMTLASVRVGQFSAQDVRCAILPAGLPGQDCLLGGTFLRNFIYRMDLATRELHLSPILADTDGPAGAAASASRTRAASPNAGSRATDTADLAAAAQAALDTYEAELARANDERQRQIGAAAADALKSLEIAKAAAVRAKDTATADRIDQSIRRIRETSGAPEQK